MKTVSLFFLFFLLVPVLINTVKMLRLLMTGPVDDSLYSQQMYREQLRRGIIEFLLSYLVLGTAAAVLFWLTKLSAE